MPILTFGPFAPDVSNFEGVHSQSLLNVVPRGDGYGPFQDFAALSAALPARCRGYFYAIKADSSIVVFAGTATKLYMMDNTDFTWDDVSKGLGTYSALSSNAQWQFEQFNNFVIATQANDVMQVFNLSSSSEFADLGGSPPQAAYISVVGRFLVASGLLSFPYRIQWSGLNATTTWTSGVNQSDFQDLADGGVVRGVAGGEYGLIFQDATIRRMTYAPGSPVIFNIDRISEDDGLFAPYSLIRAGERVFFLSPQGFKMIAPGGYPTPIGKEKVDRTFFADFDGGNIQLVLGASDPRSSRVYWAYKSISGATGLFDKILSYDWVLDKFTPIMMSGEYLASLSRPGITLEGLDALYPSIDAMTISLDDFSTATYSQLSSVDSAHRLGFFSGASLEATLIGPEKGGDGTRLFVRGFRPITDAPGVLGSVGYRENAQATVTYSAETAVNTQGLCPQRVSTRYARGKVRVTAGTTWTYAAGLEPDVTSDGKR